jgi:hypothetical protein
LKFDPLTATGMALYLKMSQNVNIYLHCKKRLTIFPSPAGMSLTKPSLGGNNEIIPVQGEFGQ